MSEETYWAERASEVEATLVARVPENKIRPRLEPTRRLVELLGDPQKIYRIIHVTGTNGKTSTTRFIERLLREHGLRTGRFTSPHLVKLNERLSIDGEPVSDEALVAAWEDIAPIVEIVDAELAAAGEGALTFFEVLAVLGFAVFADAPVDVLVLEVGMGGEWDSTNVADGDVAVFAPISLDHMERLGNTIEEIAKTKSGIIKSGAFVVASAQPAEALAVLKDKAASTADAFKSYGTDFEVLESTPDILGQKVSIRTLAGEYSDLNLPVHGYYQAENAALAVAAVEAFLGNGERRILDDIVRVSFADIASPGRLQVVSREPLTIVDGAHNPHGVTSLAKALKQSFNSPRAVGVVGILNGKNVDEMLETLAGSFEHVIITASKSDRSVEIEELASMAAKFWSEDAISVSSSVAKAIQDARELVAETELDAIVVTGSLSVVGEALTMVQEENNED